MTYKAIYSRCLEFPLWLDIAKELRDEYNIKPCYWIARESNRKRVLDEFSKTIFHAEKDAIRKIPPEEFTKIKLDVLDEKKLKNFSEYEHIIYDMMDRLELDKKITYNDRKYYYYYYLKYWSAVLDYLNPDYMITQETPHLIFDYILYILCKKRGIGTVMFQKTSPGLIVGINEFEKGSIKLKKRYCKSEIIDNEDFKLSKNMKNHFNKIQGSYDEAMPDYMKSILKKLDDNKNNGSFKKRIYDKVRFISKKYKKLKKYSKNNNLSAIVKNKFFTINPIPYYSYKTNSLSLLFFKYKLYKFKSFLKKKRLATYYNKLSENEIDLDKNYVLFALHLQPERTTSPEGDIYSDQLLVIDLLQRSLPEDWQLYIKENPKQFAARKEEQGTNYRNRIFYNKITSYENVKLIPIDVSPFSLIDNSKAVATITGTIGWESVIRNKPVLAFGYPWYRYCEGVFHITDLESCENSIKEIRDGYKVSQKRVEQFAYSLENIGLKAAFRASQVDELNKTYKKNCKIISKNINDLLLKK